jgi:hypothetical protein
MPPSRKQTIDAKCMHICVITIIALNELKIYSRLTWHGSATGSPSSSMEFVVVRTVARMRERKVPLDVVEVSKCKDVVRCDKQQQQWID